MTNDQLKTAVAEKFAESGVWVNKHLAMRILCQKVAEHTGVPRAHGETMYGYLTRFAGINRAPVAYAAKFKPMTAHKHPRLAEIEAAQPPMVTPSGTGNYNQYSPFMLNNGRSR